MTQRSCSLPALRKIFVREMEHRLCRDRIATGDIIRSATFRTGLRYPDGLIDVAWRDASYAEYHAKHGDGELAHDDSRATAPFLVTSVQLEDCEGPDDIAPGEHRLHRRIHCLRLTQNFELTAHPERIRFALDKSMFITRPDTNDISIIGFVQLPIAWQESTDAD